MDTMIALSLLATFGTLFLRALREHRHQRYLARIHLARIRTDRVFSMTETTQRIVEITEAIRQANLAFAQATEAVKAFQRAWQVEVRRALK